VRYAFLSLAIVMGLAALLCPERARAQARPTADRGLDITVFTEYAYLNPDYGTVNLKGLTLGFDFARAIGPRWITPALELRANYAGETSAAGEESAMGGLRAQFNVSRSGRFRPYGDFLIGVGQINFNNVAPYTKDNSIVYNYGAGAEFDVVGGFAVKGEFQAQHWDLGRYYTGRDTLTPTSLNIGVSYRLPFGRRMP
jgi:opacity protein-like surface antigen